MPKSSRVPRAPSRLRHRVRRNARARRPPRSVSQRGRDGELAREHPPRRVRRRQDAAPEPDHEPEEHERAEERGPRRRAAQTVSAPPPTTERTRVASASARACRRTCASLRAGRARRPVRAARTRSRTARSGRPTPGRSVGTLGSPQPSHAYAGRARGASAGEHPQEREEPAAAQGRRAARDGPADPRLHPRAHPPGAPSSRARAASRASDTGRSTTKRVRGEVLVRGRAHGGTRPRARSARSRFWRRSAPYPRRAGRPSRAAARRAEDERIARGGPVTRREAYAARAPSRSPCRSSAFPRLPRAFRGALVGGGRRPTVAQRPRDPPPLGEPPERGVHRAGCRAALAAASASASASDAAPCSTAWIRSAIVPLAVACAAAPAAHGTASSAASAAVTRVRSRATGEARGEREDRERDERPEPERERDCEQDEQEEARLDTGGPAHERQVVEVVDDERQPSREQEDDDRRRGGHERGGARRRRGRRRTRAVCGSRAAARAASQAAASAGPGWPGASARRAREREVRVRKVGRERDREPAWATRQRSGPKRARWRRREPRPRRARAGSRSRAPAAREQRPRPRRLGPARRRAARGAAPPSASCELRVGRGDGNDAARARRPEELARLRLRRGRPGRRGRRCQPGWRLVPGGRTGRSARRRPRVKSSPACSPSTTSRGGAICAAAAAGTASDRSATRRVCDPRGPRENGMLARPAPGLRRRDHVARHRCDRTPPRGSWSGSAGPAAARGTESRRCGAGDLRARGDVRGARGDRRGRRARAPEELGDLLLQIVFQAQLTKEEGQFEFADVANAISNKLVSRHPHVFGDVELKDADQVLRQWAALKREEKRAKGRGESVLEGVPREMPALARADRLTEKASRIGFDWPDAGGAREKVTEELGELDEAIAAADRDAVEHELGDVLFAVANLSRKLGIPAEEALRGSVSRFVSRFSHIERELARRGVPHGAASLEEMDALERGEGPGGQGEIGRRPDRHRSAIGFGERAWITLWAPSRPRFSRDRHRLPRPAAQPKRRDPGYLSPLSGSPIHRVGPSPSRIPASSPAVDNPPPLCHPDPHRRRDRRSGAPGAAADDRIASREGVPLRDRFTRNSATGRP